MEIQSTREGTKEADAEFLTVTELAARLKMKLSFFYAPTRRKGPEAIPCVKIGKYIRYQLPDVMMWIKTHNKTVGANKGGDNQEKA
ncbi:MAG: helix-turn-helix domain-containing protein [Syntrophales bacterium LBB04]|nr:helix-turn-helix domain-containing protein [Syntrophales bacterium LBB04]